MGKVTGVQPAADHSPPGRRQLMLVAALTVAVRDRKVNLSGGD